MKSVFFGIVAPVVLLAATAPQAVKVPVPPAPAPAATVTTNNWALVVPQGSARRYYERAVVLQAQDKPAHAIVELYRAQESQRLTKEVFDTKFTKKELSKAEQAEKAAFYEAFNRQNLFIHHLLGVLHLETQRTVDAIRALEIVVADTEHDNLPARLELARAYLDLKAWDKALAQAQQLVSSMGIRGGDADNGLKQAKAWIERHKQPGADAKITEGLKTVLAVASGVLYDNPTKFRELTLGRKVRDPLVYTELAEQFQEDDNPEEVQGMLREAIRIQDDFFPVAWLGLGSLQESAGQAAEQAKNTQTALDQYKAALKSYETAVEQLKMLDFKREKGDFDLDRITALKEKIETLGRSAP